MLDFKVRPWKWVTTVCNSHEVLTRSQFFLRNINSVTETQIMYFMLPWLLPAIDIYRGLISLKKGWNLLPVIIWHLFMASWGRKSLMNGKVWNFSASFDKYTCLQRRKNSKIHLCLLWPNSNNYRCKANFIITPISHHVILSIYLNLTFRKYVICMISVISIGTSFCLEFVVCRLRAVTRLCICTLAVEIYRSPIDTN